MDHANDVSLIGCFGKVINIPPDPGLLWPFNQSPPCNKGERIGSMYVAWSCFNSHFKTRTLVRHK